MSEDMDKRALLPCPFCGSEEAAECDNGRGLIFYVRCSVCRSAGPGERCAADAIEAWNTRALSTPSAGFASGIEAAAEEVRQLRDLVKRTEGFLSSMLSGLEDEGDRIYLASTNQADDMRDLCGDLQHAAFQIMEAESD